MSDSPTVQGMIDAGMRQVFERLAAAQAAGTPRAGWKIGVNDPVAQERLGISGALVAALDGSRILRTGDVYHPPAGGSPRLEAEVAIRMGRDVPGDVSLQDASRAIAGIAPAIEFVNGAKPRAPLSELIGHNILHDSTMLGPETAYPGECPVAEGFPRLLKGGEVVRTGLPGRVPANLGEIVMHVARTLSAYGEALRQGDIIICGTFFDPPDIAPGERYTVDFGEPGGMQVEIGQPRDR